MPVPALADDPNPYPDPGAPEIQLNSEFPLDNYRRGRRKTNVEVRQADKYILDKSELQGWLRATKLLNFPLQLLFLLKLQVLLNARSGILTF